MGAKPCNRDDMSRNDEEFLQVLYDETILRNKWIAQTPTEKQAAFLYLVNEPEVLFGGAAGPGKSSALLMAALQFVDIPGYSAILFRRTLADLEKPGALISRSREWLYGTAAHWNDRKKIWTFPSGATLAFSYLDGPNDKYNHRSAEYQFVGIDEAVDVAEEDYRFMFSRLRRLMNVEIPIRFRCCSNPGGRSHKFLYQRFLIEGKERGRIYLPATLNDNPHLDKVEYLKSLDNLDPITRAQLIAGDWSARHAGSIFRREWFKLVDAVPAKLMQVRAWDLAASLKKRSDFTVGVLMGKNRDGEFYVLDVRRAKVDPKGVNALILQTAQIDGPSVHVYMPHEPGDAGEHLMQSHVTLLAGYPLHFFHESGAGDKITRAQPFASAAGAGRVYLFTGTWVAQALDEFESFGVSGNDDVVDAAARAYSFLSFSLFADVPTNQPKKFVPTIRIEDRRKLLDTSRRVSAQRRRGMFGRY